MIKLFSRLLAESYKELGFGAHSVLRASSRLSNLNAEDIGVGETSTIKVSVGYTFSDFRRNNRLRSKRKYGSNLPFSELYDRLVRLTGVSFVDRYFETLFKGRFDTELRKETRQLLKRIDDEKASIMAAAKYRKDGMLYKATQKKLDKFEVWKSRELTDGFDELSHKIKKHIQQCLATGRIPIGFTPKAFTVKRRQALGLTPVRAFFATGQLVDNLIISYNADWS